MLTCDSASCLASMQGLARLRASTRRYLPDLDPERLADVLLVLDCLTTNALRHGRAPIRVRLQRRDGAGLLRIAVSDSAPLPAPPVAVKAHGLWLIEQVSTAWGMSPTDSGKTLWAELDLPPD